MMPADAGLTPLDRLASPPLGAACHEILARRGSMRLSITMASSFSLTPTMSPSRAAAPEAPCGADVHHVDTLGTVLQGEASDDALAQCLTALVQGQCCGVVRVHAEAEPDASGGGYSICR